MDPFEVVVKNLLKMKPQPHGKKDEADSGKEGDGQNRRPPASSSNQSD